MDDRKQPGRVVCLRGDAAEVVGQLRQAGHEAWFAGGCVRDELLGLTPKDFDVATSALPEQVRGLFRKTQAVGAAFGVILVRQGQSMVEVATFRAEAGYEDGRRPSAVRFATAEEDAQRRDFTINGLLLDPVDGRVIDYVGGQADLVARRLRAIGDANHRFAEDHLRLLRAVRFASRFGLSVEPATAQAIRRHAPSLKRISPERIAEELRRMLMPATRQAAWAMLWDFALIDTICRFLPPVEQMEYDPGRCPFAHLPGEMTVNGTIEFGLALAAMALSYRRHHRPAGADVMELLTHDSIQQMVGAMRQALRVSNVESDAMEQSLAGVAMVLGEQPMRLATAKRLVARPTAKLVEALLVSMAASGCCPGHIGRSLGQLRALDGCEVAPVPWINGDDLKQMGVPAGPSYRHILETVYDAQLEGRADDRDTALGLARSIARIGS